MPHCEPDRWAVIAEKNGVAHLMRRLKPGMWRALCWANSNVDAKMLRPRAGESLCRNCQKKLVEESNG